MKHTLQISVSKKPKNDGTSIFIKIPECKQHSRSHCIFIYRKVLFTHSANVHNKLF